jgi:transposase
MAWSLQKVSKFRIVLDGLRGEDSIAELCRREGISQGIYYK